jgi:serine/threonine-protein kinase
MTGVQVGPYRILREVGRGAAGVVYQAEEIETGRLLALKQLEVTDKSHLRRFQKEAQAARLLSHPNIVSVYELLAEDGKYFLVMEFVEGTPLAKLLGEGRRYDPATAVALLNQTALALDHAHSKGIVHRDVKPENLLIRADGVVKLVDFGIAKAEDIDANFTRVSSSAGMLGSPYYMAPEQITGRSVSPKTDQFALAVVAWELLTGQRPFDGESIHAVTYQIAHEPPRNLETAQPSLGPLAGPLLKALDKDPAKRFPGCGAFTAALQAPPYTSLLDQMLALIKSWFGKR